MTLKTIIDVIPKMRYIVYTFICLKYNIMVKKKTATLNLRIDPIIKSIAQEAAKKEQRSVANLIEVLIRRHCIDVGITIPEQKSLFNDEQ